MFELYTCNCIFSWLPFNGTWRIMPDDFRLCFQPIFVIPWRFLRQRHWTICEEYQFNPVYLWIRLDLQGHNTMGERVWQETLFFLEFWGILSWQINLFLKINNSHILFLFFVLVLSFWLCNTTDTQYILIFRLPVTLLLKNQGIWRKGQN